MNVNYCGHCGAAARPQVRFCRQCGGELFVESGDLNVSSTPAGAEQEELIYASASRGERSGNGHNGRSAASSGTLVDERRSRPLNPPPERPIEGEAGDAKRERYANGSSREMQPRSSALALASGLEGASAFGSRMMALLLGVAVLVVGVASLVYYRQSLRSFQVGRGDRNLVSPEEQSLDLIRLGKQSNELGQYEKAIGQFNNALALTPQHLPIYLLLAQSYQASGQVDEALRAYWTLLRQDPRNLEARLEVAEVLRARGNWREAYQEYQRIIDINSQSLEAIAALAMIEAHNERPYSVVRVELRKHRATTRLNMASLAPSLPGTGGAAALAPPQVQGNALKAPPNLLDRAQEDERGDVRALAESHKTLGTRYHNVREYLAAIREFSIAQRLTPNDKDLYYLLGSCYDGLDQDSLANQYYRQCDSGTYVQVARSGAQRTAKAALKESKKQEPVLGADARLPSRPTGHTLK